MDNVISQKGQKKTSRTIMAFPPLIRSVYGTVCQIEVSQELNFTLSQLVFMQIKIPLGYLFALLKAAVSKEGLKIGFFEEVKILHKTSGD